MSNMANLNPAAYVNGLVGMQNNSRVINPMHHLAIGQPPPSLNPNMTNFGLGFPTMVAANMSNQRQMQMSMGQTPSPPISRNPVYFSRPNGISGKGILRVLMFSEYLNCENVQNSKDISHWRRIVSNFFSEEGVIIYGLSDPESGENRIFEIPNPVISRFFHVNYESGVTSIQLTMNNVKESFSPPISNYGTNSTVEAKASMIYNYEDGSRVVATGRLKVRLNNLNIDCFEFITEKHVEYVPRNQPISPVSLIGPLGITLKALRCLELTEGVLTLHDLIEKCISSNKGPHQTLYALANPEQQSQTIINQPNQTPPTPGPSPPEPPAKTPKEKNENNSEIIQHTNNTDVSAPSPSTSNTNIKTESPTSKSVKSPVLNNKRQGETTPKSKKKRQLSRKNSRQETGL